MSSKYEIYVKALLEFKAELTEKGRSGNWRLVEEMVDLERAIELADLTEKQREVVQLVFCENKEQSEAADELRISQPMIHKHVQSAIRKIATIYQQQGALDYDDIILK